jgi:hypothetical protein
MLAATAILAAARITLLAATMTLTAPQVRVRASLKLHVHQLDFQGQLFPQPSEQRYLLVGGPGLPFAGGVFQMLPQRHGTGSSLLDT